MAALAHLHLPAVPPDELPGVWRGTELAYQIQATLPSGHAVLDAELPGGGWPVQAITEVLSPQPSVLEWRLIDPALQGIVYRQIATHTREARNLFETRHSGR